MSSIDLGKLQATYEKARKVAKATDTKLKSARDSNDRAKTALCEATSALESASRTILGKE